MRAASWPSAVTVPLRRITDLNPPVPVARNRERAKELPDGVWDRSGKPFFVCVSCGEAAPLELDPDVAYCGGSPRCLP